MIPIDIPQVIAGILLFVSHFYCKSHSSGMTILYKATVK